VLIDAQRWLQAEAAERIAPRPRPGACARWSAAVGARVGCAAAVNG